METPRMSRRQLLAVALVGITVALPAAAQFQKPEDAIKYRQSVFTVMANHFGRIGAMAQGRVPFDAKAAAENAVIVSDMAKLPWAAFVEGSDKGAPIRAKPEVWKDNAKFKGAAEKLVAEVAKLDAAAKSGNFDAVKAAAGAVGGACKNCHDDFRLDKYTTN
jgi:cytochrome c556